MLVRLADVSGYRRLIEFNNGLGDAGVYVKDGKLDFYLRTGATTTMDFIGAEAVFAPDTYAEVAIALGYDIGVGGHLLDGYVNGIRQVSAAPDPFNTVFLPGGGGGGLNFLQDNTSGAGLGEDSAGAVACIRAYDGVLTQAEVSQIYDDQTCPTRTPAPPPGTAGVSATRKPKAKRSGKSIIVRTGITAACPAGTEPCQGTSSVDSAGSSGRAIASKVPKHLGTASFTVAAGASQKVKTKLSKKGARALRKAGKLKITIEVTVTPPGGEAASAQQTAKIKRPRKKK